MDIPTHSHTVFHSPQTWNKTLFVLRSVVYLASHIISLQGKKREVMLMPELLLAKHTIFTGCLQTQNTL